MGLPAPVTLTSTITDGWLDAGKSPAGGWAPEGPHSEAGSEMATRDCFQSPVTAGQSPEARLSLSEESVRKQSKEHSGKPPASLMELPLGQSGFTSCVYLRDQNLEALCYSS